MRTADAFRHDLDRFEEDPAACGESLARMARDLRLCQDWMRRGAVREAAAFNIDAGNVVAIAIDLRRRDRWGDAADEAGLPDAESLEQLARLHATAGAHGREVSAWQDSCATLSPIHERLAALQSLKQLEPTDAGWVRVLDGLASAAMSHWEPLAAAAIGAGDRQELEAIRAALLGMGIQSDSGRQLLHGVEDALAAEGQRDVGMRLESAARTMHVAWAAMDVAAAQALRPAIEDLLETAGDRADIRSGVGPALAWLDRCDKRALQVARRGAQVEDLRRALDEERTMPEIERRYAAVRTHPEPLDHMLESRVAHRFQTARRRQVQRFALALTVVVALAVALTAAVTIATRNAQHQARVRDLVERIETELDADRLQRAWTTWQEVQEAGLADEPVLAAVHQRIEQTARDHADRAQRMAGLVDDALALLDGESPTLADLGHVNDILGQARDEAGTPVPAVLLELDDRRRAMLREMLATERSTLHAALTALEQTLDAPPPAGGSRLDAQAWRDWSGPAQDAQVALSGHRGSPAANDSDLAAWLDRLEARAEGHRQMATERVQAIEEVESLMARLSTTPAGERAWADTWSRLIDEHIDILQVALPQEEWFEARRGADAARAVAHWRDSVRPALAVAAGGAGLYPASPATAVGAIEALETHSESYAGSPYMDIAEALKATAVQARGGLPVERLRTPIEQSGLLELWVVPLSTGGRAFVREPGATIDRVIRTRSDLLVRPDLLDGEGLGPRVTPSGSPSPSPASQALAAGLSRVGSPDPRTALLESLDLVRAIESSGETDLLLQFEALLLAWRSIVDTQGAATGNGLGLVHAWFDDLSQLAPGALQADWPRFALSPDPSAQRSLRRQAARALMSAPPVDEVVRAILADHALADARGAARLPAAVLVPDGDGMRMADLQIPAGTPVEVLVRRGDRWYFVPVVLDDSDRVITPDTGLPRAPTIIFGQ